MTWRTTGMIRTRAHKAKSLVGVLLCTMLLMLPVHLNAAVPDDDGLYRPELQGIVQAFHAGRRIVELEGKIYRLAPDFRVLDVHGGAVGRDAVRPGIRAALEEEAGVVRTIFLIELEKGL